MIQQNLDLYKALPAGINDCLKDKALIFRNMKTKYPDKQDIKNAKEEYEEYIDILHPKQSYQAMH